MIKKFLAAFVLIFGFFSGYAQTISGIITDKTTKRFVTGAIISCGNNRTVSNIYGVFEIIKSAQGDSLKITHIGYKSYSILVPKGVETIHIELEPSINQLTEVTIHGTRDFKKDSLENRAAFANQFNYTPPKVMDAFTGNPVKQPGELISINLLTLVEALTKKNSSEYKIKQELITDEHEQYVDEHFNKGNVSRITGLKGDTLSEFLIRYRPSYAFVLKTTVYDIEVYIKSNYEKFKMEGFPVSKALYQADDKKDKGYKLN